MALQTQFQKEIAKHRKRIKELSKYEKLYDNKAEDIFKIKESFRIKGEKEKKKLYIAMASSAIIAEYFADGVSGFDLTVLSSEAKEQEVIDNFNDENSILEKLFDIGLDQSKSGYSVVRLRVEEEGDEKSVFLDIIPVDCYYPTYNRKNEIEKAMFGYYVYIEDKCYFFTETYEVIEKTLNITYNLYTTSIDLLPEKKVKVDLYDEKIEDVKLKGIDFIPVYQINNIKKVGVNYGKSDLHDPEPLIAELNDRLSQESVEFIKNLNSKLAVPSGFLDEKGESKTTDEVIEMDDDGNKPEYINNKNNLVEIGMKYIDKTLMLIASITKIPPEQFGIDTKGGAEKVEAIIVRLHTTVRKIRRKQTLMKNQLQRMYKDMLILSGISEEPAKVKIKFDSFIPVDEKAMVEILIEKVNARLLSKETAMRMANNFDKEQLEDEKEKISKEESDVLGTKPILRNNILPNEEI